MLDRPAPADATLTGLPRRHRPRWPLAVMGVAGILGAAGVGVGAAGAHGGGADLARIASEFLLIHAVALLAAVGVVVALGRTSALLVAAIGLLGVGAALFGGELALAALLDWRPLPLAAPVGGLCLIAGWLTLTISAIVLGVGWVGDD